MSSPLFDPAWYRVAELKPRIRSHAQFHRHRYRGETWYVLQDHTSERFHRFAPAAYFLIGLMDGKRTVQEIWDQAINALGDDAPTQSEAIQTLSHLHSADVLQTDVTPDSAEIFQRYQNRRTQERWQKIKSPLSIRIPLLDPERLLERFEWLVKPWFTRLGAFIWLLIVGSAVVLAVEHWPELTENVTERVMAPQNLLLLWLTFPVVKALHELGHGFATKVWGGEVHEMGIMLLVLMPIPYVDASAASAFRERVKRSIVGAAGMLTEVLLASFAFFVWLLVEPGLVRTTAYNIMLIAGVSTVLFNGNPLLRFDGYYIFADLVDIPNLASRSNRYLGYLVQRYVFGVTDAEQPSMAKGERFWFVAFGITSFIYRMFIYTFIVLFVAGKFFFIGVLLAAWAVFSMIVQPLFKGVRFVLTNSRLRRQRGRAVASTLGFVAAIVLAIVLLPLPYFTRAEGVIWVPEESIVRAGSSGFVAGVVAVSGSEVAQGETLMTLEDPELTTEAAVVAFQLDEAVARRRALQVDDLVQAEITDDEITRLQGRLEHVQARQAAQTVTAPVSGVFLLPNAEDLKGRFLQQGEQVAYVIEPGHTTARVVVDQARVDLVRQRVRDVEVRLTNRNGETIKATVLREVPAATKDLPSLALGSIGGGSVAVDPRDANAPRALENLFQFDLELADPAAEYLGSRLYARFDHGFQPLGFRWYRAMRQLLLGRFDV
ncbi:MAG: HlyD family efflux transporter periplasmic adaptor subunit [Gammaproteobacteria bacterium]|nr:HlyD family efflux transporter periplasmic adaptor subunit [Gammaproteobacteria bacterium]